MKQQDPSLIFNQAHAERYDERFVKLAPLRDALHLFTAAILAELPPDAHVLSVGAGTGLEMIALARRFPGWRFSAVEPSGPMLEVCRRRVQEEGLTERCTFHHGFLASLDAPEAFHAATSFLVSHFILDPQERSDYFRAIATRLRPGGILVTSDLAADTASPGYPAQLHLWLRLMKDGDLGPDELENLRAAYARDVALLPPAQLSALIASSGFEAPDIFLQTGLIHAQWARRVATDQMKTLMARKPGGDSR